MSMESIKLTQESPKVKEYKYHFKEIENLREPMQTILEGLKEKIETGEYQLIIGEDASGRIPTRVIERIVKERYKENNYAQPDVRFVAGPGQCADDRALLNAEKVRIKYINEIKKKAKKRRSDIKKALLITDTVIGGNSLLPLANALKKNNLSFDIATIQVRTAGDIKELKKKLGAETIVWGEEFSFDDEKNIYGKYDIAGVEKTPPHLFSESYAKKYSDHYKSQIFLQKDVNTAREDAKILAEELMKSYKNALAAKK